MAPVGEFSCRRLHPFRKHVTRMVPRISTCGPNGWVRMPSPAYVGTLLTPIAPHRDLHPRAQWTGASAVPSPHRHNPTHILPLGNSHLRHEWTGEFPCSPEPISAHPHMNRSPLGAGGSTWGGRRPGVGGRRGSKQARGASTRRAPSRQRTAAPAATGSLARTALVTDLFVAPLQPPERSRRGAAAGEHPDASQLSTTNASLGKPAQNLDGSPDPCWGRSEKAPEAPSLEVFFRPGSVLDGACSEASEVRGGQRTSGF